MTQLFTANVFADTTLKTSDVFVSATRTPISKKNVIADITLISEEQIKLAVDSTYQPTKIVWSSDSAGNQHKVEQPKRIKRWWVELTDGTVQLTVRYGSKPLEFSKGKNAIALKNKESMSAAITVKGAVAQTRLTRSGMKNLLVINSSFLFFSNIAFSLYYSHSIVANGLLEISYLIQNIPFTLSKGFLLVDHFEYS